ncbi:MAG: anti-sigma factor family protein [Flavonifractor plautii]
MLTCEQALELISAQLDGALTAEEAGAGQHLAQCPACRALRPISPPCTSFCPLWRRSPPPG